MVRPTDEERIVIEKIVCYLIPKSGEHTTPCRATWGSTRVSHEADRSEAKT